MGSFSLAEEDVSEQHDVKSSDTVDGSVAGKTNEEEEEDDTVTPSAESCRPSNRLLSWPSRVITSSRDDR